MNYCKKIIDEVVKKGLCTRCGSCVALSKNGEMFFDDCEKKYLPNLNKNLNDNNKIVWEGCSGADVDFPKINEYLFSKQPENLLIGNYLNAYVGYSKNQKMRDNAGSGGAITTLIKYLLDNKMVDGVITLHTDPEKPWLSTPYVAESIEDYKSISQSRYCISPVNTILDKIDKYSQKYISNQ